MRLIVDLKLLALSVNLVYYNKMSHKNVNERVREEIDKLSPNESVKKLALNFWLEEYVRQNQDVQGRGEKFYRKEIEGSDISKN